ALRVRPATCPLGVDRREAPGDIETAREVAVRDVALPPDPDGETVHDLATAPRAVLARVLEVRRDEREGVAVKAEVLPVRDRVAAAGWAQPRHRRAVRDRRRDVLVRARENRE